MSERGKVEKLIAQLGQAVNAERASRSTVTSTVWEVRNCAAFLVSLLGEVEELEATLRNERIGMREVREVNATLHQECDSLKADRDRLREEIQAAYNELPLSWSRLPDPGKLPLYVFKLREENERLREKCKEFREALIWCSGAEDFQEGGKARVGWQKLQDRLLKKPTQEEDQPNA